MSDERYTRLLESLNTTGSGTMKCHGNSMKPILENPSVCTYKKLSEYEVGHIVFCKVHGRFIDAHKIVKKDVQDGRVRYQIANNRGHINGWTSRVFGRVVRAVDMSGNERSF